MEAAIIIIGNEVLSGETLDTNSQFIGQELNKVGYNIFKKLSIPDDRQEIFQALDLLMESVEVIIVSGGLGPTSDDITKTTLAEYFGTPLEYREEVYQNITQLLKGRYQNFPQHIRDQAMIPQKAKHLKNSWGTASGMLFKEHGKMVISLPGVPYEMRGILSHEVIPILKANNPGSFLMNKNIRTIGVPEAFIANRIQEIEEGLPEWLKIAYLPSLGQVKIRLTGRGDDEEKIRKEINTTVRSIEAQIGEHVYGYDEDSIQEIIGKLLIGKNASLATAESCTGGYVAHLITSVPGSSAYFKGSIVAYLNEVKEKFLNVDPNILKRYGAVSRECVEHMAKGAAENLGVDYAIATSGIAGPDGGTKEKPVGTVWLAVAGDDRVISKQINFDRGRAQNIKYFAISALTMLWHMLK